MEGKHTSRRFGTQGDGARPRGARRERNALGRTLQAVTDTTLNDPAKRILSWSPVLARLVKYSLDEFDGLSADEVERLLLEDAHVWVGERPLHMEDEAARRAGLLHAQLGGLSVVDETLGEGPVTFDILADVPVPGAEGYDMLVVNVEPQRQHADAHYLSRRALYYAARMVSAQRGRVFESDDYDGVRKVVTIWLLPYPPARLRGTVLSFELGKEVLCGAGDVDKADYDLVQVVLVCVDPDDPDAGGDNLLMSLTSALFCEKMGAEERERRLADHGVTLDEQAREDLSEMKSMVEAIGEEHYRRGREKGREEVAAQAARALMEAQGLTAEDALDLLRVDGPLRERVLPELGQR